MIFSSSDWLSQTDSVHIRWVVIALNPTVLRCLFSGRGVLLCGKCAGLYGFKVLSRAQTASGGVERLKYALDADRYFIL